MRIFNRSLGVSSQEFLETCYLKNIILMSQFLTYCSKFYKCYIEHFPYVIFESLKEDNKNPLTVDAIKEPRSKIIAKLKMTDLNYHAFSLNQKQILAYSPKAPSLLSVACPIFMIQRILHDPYQKKTCIIE